MLWEFIKYFHTGSERLDPPLYSNSKYQFGLGAKTGSIREDPLIDCMKKNNN